MYGSAASTESRGLTHVKTYAFDVVLKDVFEVTGEQAYSLFAAGCEDGTPSGCEGVARVHFDREAASLEEAIVSALVQVQTAGFTVSRVVLDGATAVALRA